MFYKLCTRKCTRIAPKVSFSGLFYAKSKCCPVYKKAPTISRGALFPNATLGLSQQCYAKLERNHRIFLIPERIFLIQFIIGVLFRYSKTAMPTNDM